MSGNHDDGRLTVRPFEGLCELKAELKKMQKQQRKERLQANLEIASVTSPSSTTRAEEGREKERRAQADKGLTSRPLQALGELKGELKREHRQQRKEQRLSDANARRPPLSSPSPSRVSPPQPSGGHDADTDTDAFAKAMADVVPLTNSPRVARGGAHREPMDSNRKLDEAQAIDNYLRDLVDGIVPFDIADTDEYIEGSIQGLDRRILRRLRRGDLSIQDHLDLHGHRRDEARAEVARFIKRAHAHGLRCVLVVHGRGLNSKDQIPVLKEKLKAWLTRGAIGTKVLAFASARPYDGGTGAVYVLLRK